MNTSLRNRRYRKIRRERRGVATLACAADYAALPQAYGTGRATIVSSGQRSEKESSEWASREQVKRETSSRCAVEDVVDETAGKERDTSNANDDIADIDEYPGASKRKRDKRVQKKRDKYSSTYPEQKKTSGSWTSDDCLVSCTTTRWSRYFSSRPWFSLSTCSFTGVLCARTLKLGGTYPTWWVLSRHVSPCTTVSHTTYTHRTQRSYRQVALGSRSRRGENRKRVERKGQGLNKRARTRSPNVLETNWFRSTVQCQFHVWIYESRKENFPVLTSVCLHRYKPSGCRPLRSAYWIETSKLARYPRLRRPSIYILLNVPLEFDWFPRKIKSCMNRPFEGKSFKLSNRRRWMGQCMKYSFLSCLGFLWKMIYMIYIYTTLRYNPHIYIWLRKIIFVIQRNFATYAFHRSWESLLMIHSRVFIIIFTSL